MADGKAHQLALQLVEQAARIMGASRLIPISFAHVDACFYTGQTHIDFVKFLLEHGGKLSVPTWTNNSVASPMMVVSARTCRSLNGAEPMS
jgi:predicted aconitase